MTIKDIAKLAGVSVSTVSKVMNQKDSSISQKTRERVLQIARSCNYSPYAAFISQHLKYFHAKLLIRENSLLFDSVMKGLLSEAQSKGYTVSLSMIPESDPEIESLFSELEKSRIDLILWERSAKAGERAEDSFQKKLSALQLPSVSLFSDDERSFHMDLSHISYGLTESYHRNHFEKTACVLDPEKNYPGFIEGYREYLFDHRLPIPKDLIYDKNRPELLDELIEKSVSAVLCPDSGTAIRIYQRAAALHYQIPSELSICTLNHGSELPSLFPDINFYELPAEEFGRFILRGALRQLEGGDKILHSFSPSFVKSRQSRRPVSAAKRECEICIVGSINIDNYLNVSTLPVSGKTVSSSSQNIYPGGKGTNEAIGAAKLGHRVSLIGNVGRDRESHLIYDTLRKYHVQLRGVSRCPEKQTGRAHIIVDPRGESLISILSGANSSLSAALVREKEELFRRSSFSLVCTEIPMDAVLEACRLSQKYGGKTILKPSSCGELPAELLRYIDILIPNLNELNEICPGFGSMQEKAQYFLDKNIPIVIVTLGSRGCFLKTKDREKSYPAIDIPSVDSTGAGDAFISALASYLLYGYDLDRSIRIAGFAAGISTSRSGCVPSLADRNTLETYISQREPSLLSPKGSCPEKPKP